MILTGDEIEQAWKAGTIGIERFEPEHLSPNSYDLALGDRLRRYTGDVMDPDETNRFEEIRISPDGYEMAAGEFLIAFTQERITSPHFVPILHSRSGAARMGLFAHVTGDLLQRGFAGHAMLQLFATLPITIRAGARIAQISFWVPTDELD